jgi:phenylacetate-CoA ligase
MSDDTAVEDEFVSSSLGLWEKRETEEGVEYAKNGVPRSEEAYQAAKASSLPQDKTVSPYGVVDFSEEEIDRFAENPGELSDDEFQALKDVRAVYTARHAYENTEFYRDQFDEQGIDPYEIEGIEDLEEVPVIDGDDILANQPPATDDFRLENPNAQTRRILNTSGTTGNPKEFKKSYDEMENWDNDIEHWLNEYGLGEGDNFVNYFPFVGLNASGIGIESGIEEAGGTSIPITNTPYPTEVEANKLKRYSSEDEDTNYAMLGLASHIDSKGKKFERAGFDPEEFGLDVIMLAGEPVSESRKENISETFDAEVYEFLGSTESGAFAYECLDDPNRLHVLDHRTHVDILDPETEESVDEGEEGSLTVTNLLHPGEESSMPLINYDLGDFTTEYESSGVRENAGQIDIMPPRRDSWDFVFGAVNLDPTFFEDNIYDHPDLSDVAEDYQVRVDYDGERGQDEMDIVIASQEEDLVGQAASFGSSDGRIGIEGEEDSIAADIGQDFLEGHSHLEDTVSVGAARFNVEIVDEIEMEPGKPQRLIDRREA